MNRNHLLFYSDGMFLRQIVKVSHREQAVFTRNRNNNVVTL